VNEHKHGHAIGSIASPTYSSWQAMKSRCLNPQTSSYRNYGGRGIKIYDRWLDFKNFLADMGERPEGTSLDRFPNKNGNYEPGNCRWATRLEQNRNQRIRKDSILLFIERRNERVVTES
jgi:hypothetical protein